MGFTYDQWLDLWAQGKLSDIFKKSAKDLETYGDEGPFPLTCEIGGVELDQSEIPDNLPTDLPADPLTDSEPEKEPLDLAQNHKQNHLNEYILAYLPKKNRKILPQTNHKHYEDQTDP